MLKVTMVCDPEEGAEPVPVQPVQVQTVSPPVTGLLRARNAVDDLASLIEGARTLGRRIKNSNLVTFDTGGHLLLGHEEEIKHQ